MNTSLAPTTATATAAGLPPVNQALAPASVRNGSPAVQKAYASALNFESMLVQQLSQSLAETGGLGGGEGGSEAEGSSSEGGLSAGGSTLGGGDAVSSELSSLLPQTLANGVMSQGGLGLAQQLMSAIDPAASPAAGAIAPGAAAVGGTLASVSAPVPAPSSSKVGPSGGVSA